MKNLLFSLLVLIFASCEIENYTYYTPIMITDEPRSVLQSSAQLGGRVLGEGGKPVTEFGLVWGQELPLDINVNKVIEGERIGFFSGTYELFEPNTTYYYSAYGINEEGTGYGQVFEFKTSAKPSCDPITANLIDFGPRELGIYDVQFTTETGFNDGNIEFRANASNSALFMTIGFNESNQDLPLTGAYSTIRDFDNQSVLSNTEVRVNVLDYSINSIGGGRAPEDQKLYVENMDGTITFIFCDFKVGNNLILNGKCTYSP